MECPNCHTKNSKAALFCTHCKGSLDPYSIDLARPDLGGMTFETYSPELGPEQGSRGERTSRGLSKDHERKTFPEDSDDEFVREGSARIPKRRPVSEPETARHRPAVTKPESRPDPDAPKEHSGKPKPDAEPFGAQPSDRAHPSIKDGRTVQYEGIDIRSLRNAEHYVLQIFSKGGWRRLKSFGSKGIKIGSGEGNDRVPALQSMAARHLRLTPEGSRLMVQDLGSLSGVFRRLTKPHPLSNRTQFRIGHYLIEFRLTEPLPEAVPCHRQGERLSCVDLVVPAVLVFVRPSGEDGTTFPLTKTETLLGQEREDGTSHVDIHLPADMTSGRHARVVRKAGRYFLENLSETIGTFVRIPEVEQIHLGEEILAGQIKFRVIEEKE
jgi:pSer/pThr/pTyr-binding forkhead associated (FHA) protein